MAIKDLDSNNDGKVDNQDTNFSSLKIWQDKNSDGKLDEGELLSLAEIGIQSLNTTYQNSTEIDTNNNTHKQQGSFTTTDGTTNKMNDVWFDVDLAKTIETDLVEVNDIIANLPNLAGFGNVHSLHQAMALDTSGELQALVEQVISTSGSEQDGLLIQMIYHWAGVEDIDPNSRLSNDYSSSLKDSRKLEALEVLMGDEFLGTWCWVLVIETHTARLHQLLPKPLMIYNLILKVNSLMKTTIIYYLKYGSALMTKVS